MEFFGGASVSLGWLWCALVSCLFLPSATRSALWVLLAAGVGVLWQGDTACEGLLIAHQLAASVSRASLSLLLAGSLLW